MERRRFCRLSAGWLLAGFSPSVLMAGAPSRKAVYHGGTPAGLEPGAKGEVSAVDPQRFEFAHAGGVVQIPYEQINSLEYGQKAGRRLGLALAVSPLFLLSRKRKHYLTIGYIDQSGAQQAVVLELGKKIVRTTLAGLEARTGLLVEFEDEQARRSVSQ